MKVAWGILLIAILSLGCVGEETQLNGPLEIAPETDGVQETDTPPKTIRWSKDIPVFEINIFKDYKSKITGIGEFPLLGSLSFVADKNGKIVSLNPSSAIDVDENDDIYIAWNENPGATIHLKKIDRDGKEIIPDLSVGKCPETAWAPVISILKNNIYLMFRCEREITTERSEFIHFYNLSFLKLSLDGTPLQNNTVIVGEDLNPWEFKASFDSDESINVVYSKISPQWRGRRVFYVKTDNSGNKLMESINLTIEQNVGTTPELITDSYDNTHIVWIDGPKYYEPGYLYYAQVKKGGDTLSNRKILANGVKDSPSIKIDSKDNIHVVWSTENDSIEYLKMNVDGDEVKRESIISEKARFPSLAIGSDDRVHVTWVDGRYRREPQIAETGFSNLFMTLSNIYYKTTMDISEIEKQLQPINPPIDNFVVEIPKDPVKFYGSRYNVEGEISEEQLEEIRKSPIVIPVGVWGTGIKGNIYFISNASWYSINEVENKLYRGSNAHYFKFVYNRDGEFLSASISKHGPIEFENWDAKIDVVDTGADYILNITFRQPIQSKEDIVKKLDEFTDKKNQISS